MSGYLRGLRESKCYNCKYVLLCPKNSYEPRIAIGGIPVEEECIFYSYENGFVRELERVKKNAIEEMHVAKHDAKYANNKHARMLGKDRKEMFGVFIECIEYVLKEIGGRNEGE